MIRAAEPASDFVDRKLPRPLQTYVSLYGSWIERLRTAPQERRNHSVGRRLIGLLLIDTAALAAVIAGTAVQLGRLAQLLSGWTGLSENGARVAVVATASALAAPLLFGGFRTARVLATTLAVRAFPEVARGRIDNSAAPRRALVNTLQFAIVLVAGVLVVAATQPFLPPLGGFAALVPIVLMLLIAFWRSTANLHGHATAGAEVIAAMLQRQVARSRGSPDDPARARVLQDVLPGLGHPEPVELTDGSNAIGKSLAELNLRGRTGATILAITRGAERIVIPSGQEVLRAGDFLAIAGSHDAVEAARAVLNHPRATAG
jgi:CPA2 family monovalent cation:H+ antiporter-2